MPRRRPGQNAAAGSSRAAAASSQDELFDIRDSDGNIRVSDTFNAVTAISRRAARLDMEPEAFVKQELAKRKNAFIDETNPDQALDMFWLGEKNTAHFDLDPPLTRHELEGMSPGTVSDVPLSDNPFEKLFSNKSRLELTREALKREDKRHLMKTNLDGKDVGTIRALRSEATRTWAATKIALENGKIDFELDNGVLGLSQDVFEPLQLGVMVGDLVERTEAWKTLRDVAITSWDLGRLQRDPDDRQERLSQAMEREMIRECESKVETHTQGLTHLYSVFRRRFPSAPGTDPASVTKDPVTILSERILNFALKAPHEFKSQMKQLTEFCDNHEVEDTDAMVLSRYVEDDEFLDKLRSLPKYKIEAQLPYLVERTPDEEMLELLSGQGARLPLYVSAGAGQEPYFVDSGVEKLKWRVTTEDTARTRRGQVTQMYQIDLHATPKEGDAEMGSPNMLQESTQTRELGVGMVSRALNSAIANLQRGPKDAFEVGSEDYRIIEKHCHSLWVESMRAYYQTKIDYEKFMKESVADNREAWSSFEDQEFAHAVAAAHVASWANFQTGVWRSVFGLSNFNVSLVSYQRSHFPVQSAAFHSFEKRGTLADKEEAQQNLKNARDLGRDAELSVIIAARSSKQQRNKSLLLPLYWMASTHPSQILDKVRSRCGEDELRQWLESRRDEVPDEYKWRLAAMSQTPEELAALLEGEGEYANQTRPLSVPKAQKAKKRTTNKSGSGNAGANLSWLVPTEEEGDDEDEAGPSRLANNYYAALDEPGSYANWDPQAFAAQQELIDATLAGQEPGASQDAAQVRLWTAIDDANAAVERKVEQDIQKISDRRLLDLLTSARDSSEGRKSVWSLEDLAQHVRQTRLISEVDKARMKAQVQDRFRRDLQEFRAMQRAARAESLETSRAFAESLKGSERYQEIVKATDTLLSGDGSRKGKGKGKGTGISQYKYNDEEDKALFERSILDFLVEPTKQRPSRHGRRRAASPVPTESVDEEVDWATDLGENVVSDAIHDEMGPESAWGNPNLTEIPVRKSAPKAPMSWLVESLTHQWDLAMEVSRESTERQARTLRLLIDQAPDAPATQFASSSARARSTDRSTTARTHSQTESVQEDDEEERSDEGEQDNRGRRALLALRTRAASSGGGREDAVRAVGDWASHG